MTGPEPARPPEYRYHLLRAAQERFGRNPGVLDPGQLAEARQQADRTFALETLVLGSPEAQGLIPPPERVDAALAEIARRYADEAALAEDLADNGLDGETLRRALHRELTFDAVMTRIGARAAAVGELDLRLYYELNRDRFTRPEQRTVRQILVTVNEAFPENHRDQALARLEQIAARLDGRAQRFGGLARRHSECPTALEDGRLGTVGRGQLYPELDAVLFALPEGAVSPVVESELGFHLLLCERIHPARTLPFHRVRERIRELLTERTRRNCQKAWIAQIRRAAGTEALS
jgi:peptidyl-prolyl cis-trans isomerase C